ncbi:DegT/DnrJ/EryC1/StrS family aminotransferase, partial [Prochlorococcus sp. AH-716-F13]|nr:DegT/DnrJ/EryC1/StrS family aminotransferase [Prochlorococcus sp. AH-716-F13]
EQVSSVKEILESGRVNYWTGDQGKLFEKEFSQKFDIKYSVALANGSLALSSAYLALGLQKGDEIITTPRTFIATSSSAVLLGLKPVFVDVDIDSGNISFEKIEKAINKKTKVIVVVHLAGWPAEMIKINQLAKEYSLFVIEDCSQAHGAKINGRNVGTFGDIATWSFCQDKIITTGGEGGMLTTNNYKFFKKVWSFKDHGKAYKYTEEKSKNFSYRWIHDNFGSNFRLTEMQSTIGRIQIKKLTNWISLRNRNANILISYLSKFDQIRIPTPPKNLDHAYYKFYCYVDENSFKAGWDRKRIINELNMNDFPAFTGSCSEIYLEKCFKDSGLSPGENLENASILGKTSIMFLVHPTITLEQMHTYSLGILKSFTKALK